MSIMDTLITNRTQADVDARNAKGTYNASDLNRVGAAVAYVAGRLLECGTSVYVSPKHDWSESDIPTVSQMEQYRSDIATLRDALDAMPTTPQVPATMNNLTLSEANAIEKILQDTSVLIFNMQAAWFYSNDIFAGEV